MHASDWLNLALYPAELDYQRTQPLPATWHSLQASVARADSAWSPPADLGDPGRPLVYLSLGSLGSADLPLMRQLVDALAQTRCRVVVSKGPLHDQLELPDGHGRMRSTCRRSRCCRRSTSVITHGGNNTVTECSVLRQADGGAAAVLGPARQRAADRRRPASGSAARPTTSAPTSSARPWTLCAAIPPGPARLAAISRRLQSAPGTGRAADLLEELVHKADGWSRHDAAADVRPGRHLPRHRPLRPRRSRELRRRRRRDPRRAVRQRDVVPLRGSLRPDGDPLDRLPPARRVAARISRSASTRCRTCGCSTPATSRCRRPRPSCR